MCSSNARFCVSLVTPDATTKISNEAFQFSHFVAKPEMSVLLNSKGPPIRSIQQPCYDVEHGRQLLLFSSRHCFFLLQLTVGLQIKFQVSDWWSLYVRNISTSLYPILVAKCSVVWCKNNITLSTQPLHLLGSYKTYTRFRVYGTYIQQYHI